MENDLLDNPQFDDFNCFELVTWWFILSQCSRAQTGMIKLSLEKLQRNREIPVEVSFGAVLKLIRIGALRITDEPRVEDVTHTLRPRDVGVTDTSRLRDGGVENASHSRNATNERTNETDVRNEHGDLKTEKQKNLNPTELVNKGAESAIGDNSQGSSENFGAAGEGEPLKPDQVTEAIDLAIARGRHTQAVGMIRTSRRLEQHYADFLKKHDPGGKMFGSQPEGNA